MPSRTLAYLFAFGIVSSVTAQPAALVAPTNHQSPEDERKSFKLPPGFQAQLVASEPDINKPMQLAFDAKGRLWVPVTVEYPYAAIGRPGKDRLMVLSDFGPDGKAGKVSTFADGLNIPIGVLPLPDCKSVLVSSIDPGPDGAKEAAGCWIWKLTDTDGDGKADKREKLYGPFGIRDTHGMVNSFTLMPDGWVYACHGFSNDSKVKGKDGHEVQMNSGSTFRFRPDGSRIEVYSRGQVNPFGMTHDAFFNLYTADCHSRPMTQNIRGAVYESFGKPHDGLGFGPNMIGHDHGSTGLCGLAWYEADQFPKDYIGRMFLGNVVTNRVNMDLIEFTGSTPKAIEQPDFMASGDPWFRPVDIKLGTDGALYISDFYNKIIGHYEVELKHPGRDRTSGRIWRIVYSGMDGKGKVPPPPVDFTKLDRKQLDEKLGDPNIAVRMMATQTLINPINPTEERRLDELSRRDSSLSGRRHAAQGIWANNAHSIDDHSVRKRQELAFDLNDDLIGTHYMRFQTAMKEWQADHERGGDNREKALREAPDRLVINPKFPQVGRAIADGLTAVPHLDSVSTLVKGLKNSPAGDTHLRQALRIALRECLRDANAWKELKVEATMLPTIADVATGLPTPEAAAFLSDHLTELTSDAGRLPAYVEHASRYGDGAKPIFAFVTKHKPDDTKLALALFQAYTRGLQQRNNRFDEGDIAFAEKLVARGLKESDPQAIQSCFDVSTALRLKSLYGDVASFAARTDRNEGQRAAALATMVALDPVAGVVAAAKVLADADAPIGMRERAAQSLGVAGTKEAVAALLGMLERAPARLQTVIAIALASKPDGADQLLKTIAAGKASGRLLQDRTVAARINESKLPKAGERVAELTKGLPNPDQRMLDLINKKRESFVKSNGDAKLGAAIFKTNCQNCHQLGGEGPKIGPQLDGIGIRGLDRLLEDIFDPSRNVDQAFRSTSFVMKDGRTVAGLVLRQEGAVFVLADNLGKEVRLAEADIDEKRSSLLSPMPANFAETVKEDDFRHLLAFLLSHRAKER